jgi:hypothetical protein
LATPKIHDYKHSLYRNVSLRPADLRSHPPHAHSWFQILQTRDKQKLDQKGRAYAWLELADIFQTFSELDEVKDKTEDIRLIRQLIDEDVDTKSDDEEVVC